MAKRKGAGSGLVITLVVFILLAITGTGVSIHFYQQWMLAEQAINANQNAFRQQVADKFAEAGWDLPARSRDRYGIVYEREAYAGVREKLDLASDFEALQPRLPWRNLTRVERALADYSPEGERFSLVDRLLEYYAAEYVTLRERIAELNRRNQNFVRELAEKDEERVRIQNEMNQKLDQIEADYSQRLRTLRAQYAEMEQKWQRARDERGLSFARLENRIEEMVRKAETEQRLRVEKEREMARLERLIAPEERPDLVEDGRVLAVERDHDFIMITGGHDEQRQRNERIVLYHKAPDGEASYIGTAIIARVYETTSLASVTDRDIPVLEGQVFVRQSVWTDIHPTDVAVRPEPEQPVRTPDRPDPVVPEPAVDRPVDRTTDDMWDDPEEDEDPFFIF